jgi:hypothetical protein
VTGQLKVDVAGGGPTLLNTTDITITSADTCTLTINRQ